MDDFQWATSTLAARAADYRTAYNYYEGAHALTFATEKFRETFGSLLREFADNLCPAVIDTACDRLEVIGFIAEGGNQTLGQQAWDIWQANRMDERSQELHFDALTGGDAYLVVWPDAAGQPTLYPNEGSYMCVKYDPETPGLITQAAKAWLTDDKLLRLTLYYPDRVEKWLSKNRLFDGLTNKLDANAFEPYTLPGEAWPLPNEWGEVPVFHFANTRRTGRPGRSELADVIPLQNALNKSVCDMLVAMEFVALPQRWATGLEIEVDPITGKPVKTPFVPGVDRIWSVASPETRFGEFGTAQLEKIVAVQESFRTEIARVSRTPLHYLIPSGEFPSGEAMKTAEAPLLAKLKKLHAKWGNVWENALRLALRMAGTADDSRLSAQWRDPTPRNEAEFLAGLEAKERLGVPKRQLQLEIGYTEEQATQFAAEKTEESAALGQQLLTAFDQGR